MRTRLTVACLAAVAAAGCAADPSYTQPYAVFTTQQAVRMSGGDGVRILVDDQEVRLNEALTVAPGSRRVTLSAASASGATKPVGPTLTVDAKPCTRYVMIATRSAPTDDDWSAQVNSTEPIGECAKKFGGY